MTGAIGARRLDDCHPNKFPSPDEIIAERSKSSLREIQILEFAIESGEECADDRRIAQAGTEVPRDGRMQFFEIGLR
jgi:hypothetical protein